MIAKLCILFGICMSTISGQAVVHDGDTIRINGQAIRLQGLDAEELSEPNGIGARDALRSITEGRIVTCTPDGTHSYERVVAICTIDGIDIGIPMVAAGWALDCPRYSGGRYRTAEQPGSRTHLIQKPYCRPGRSFK